MLGMTVRPSDHSSLAFQLAQLPMPLTTEAAHLAPGTPVVLAGQVLPLFQTAGVAAEVQAIVTAKGIVSVAHFAGSCDSKTEVSEKCLVGTDFSQNLLRVASLEQAWREAEKRTEQRLSKAESALPQLETSFLRRCSWLRTSSKMIGCDSLPGRVRREFDREAARIFKMSQVRTRAQSSFADPCKRRRLSQHVSFTLGVRAPRRNANLWDHGLLCQAARSGSNMGCGRNTTVHWKGSEKLYAHWSELSDNVEGLQERVSSRCAAITLKPLSRHVCAVEEDFRSRAVELARTPGAPMPWSTALLQAAHDDANRSDQRRDFLNASTVRASAAQIAAVKRELGLPRNKGKGKGTNKTVDKISGKPVCRAFNDGRGRERWCSQSREHRCVVRLTSGEACGSRDHRRSSHDPKLHGIPALRS